MKYLIEAIAAAALLLSLACVCTFDWAILGDRGPGENTLKNVKVIGGGKRDGTQKKLKLAVTPSGKSPAKSGLGFDLWDDMGKLLKELGEGYQFDELREDQLVLKHQQGKLNDYDVIFLTCSPSADNEKLREPLVSYVANGGILYASDWRFDTIANAFPDLVVEKLKGQGGDQKVEAEVVDADLREALGADKIELKFDLGEWKTAAFGGPRVKILLQGKYRIEKRDTFATAPLMVKFKFDKGTVIFTSFHNEKQNSRTEKQLLHYLVFSLVTAGIDDEINSDLNKQGFTPQRSNLLSNAEKQSIEKTYENKHECTLRFTLGFRSEGSKLTFNIKSPDGKQFTKEAESTMGLEVANAAKGTWTYTVTADPRFTNTPFRVTVGEKK